MSYTQILIVNSQPCFNDVLPKKDVRFPTAVFVAVIAPDMLSVYYLYPFRYAHV